MVASAHTLRAVPYAIAAFALLAASAVGGLGDPAGTFVAGMLVRAVFFGAVGVVLRALYLRSHEGDLYSPDALWIGAGLAALIAAGRLWA